MAHLICPIPPIREAPAIPDVSLAPGDTTAAANDEPKEPKSILIIGSGVFGLSTALSLARRPEFPSDTPITIIDRSPEPGVFPARDASSIDSSRIIRADYADPAYAELAAEAHVHWRRDIDNPDSLGGDGRYNESGLLLAAENGPDGATVRPDGHPTGLGYTRRSWVNAMALAHKEGRSLQSVRLLPSAWAIGKMMQIDGHWADWGYVNTAAGWADAERSMKWLYDRVVATGRVTFVNGTVEALESQTAEKEQQQRITGARLSDGRRFSADLVIVATGAWTPTLVDLAGSAVATGQCIGYLRLTDDEQAKLAKIPVCLNLTDGCFVIPPRDNVLKIARHSYGYLNPQPVSHEPLNSSRTKDKNETNKPVATAMRTISQPRTHLTDPSLDIPAEGTSDLRRALGRMFPWLADRPFFKTRLCWYTDTPTGDWIIDYHPTHKNLFIATGGSGHGFKFLPILGDKVVDCILGQCPEVFREKWKWKGGLGINGNAAGGVTEGTTGESDNLGADTAVELSVATEDGSRGGKPGLILGDEMAKSAKS
ncbi:FAD dependent oxidoreductase-domain-containing protein [Xylaria sp. FL1042]|nr:FAD dependent oxidoreductase-domain-containing protein [Xylaria sp. FL1042]